MNSIEELLEIYRPPFLIPLATWQYQYDDPCALWALSVDHWIWRLNPSTSATSAWTRLFRWYALPGASDFTPPAPEVSGYFLRQRQQGGYCL